MKRRNFLQILLAGIPSLFVATKVVAQPKPDVLLWSDAALVPDWRNYVVNPDFTHSGDHYYNGARIVGSPLIPKDEVWYCNPQDCVRDGDSFSVKPGREGSMGRIVLG